MIKRQSLAVLALTVLLGSAGFSMVQSTRVGTCDGSSAMRTCRPPSGGGGGLPLPDLG